LLGADSTRRTAGCGPACPVVWQGRVGDHSPYADCTLQQFFSAMIDFRFRLRPYR